MKRFSKLMSLLLFAAVIQYSCINDADVAFSDESHTDSNGNLAYSLKSPMRTTLAAPNHQRDRDWLKGMEYAVKSLTVYLSIRPLKV